MPFVVKKVETGEYLFRPVNAGYRRNRQLTTDIRRASVWSTAGHAKLAARELVKSSPQLATSRTVLAIIEVTYTEVATAAFVRVKKIRSGGETKVVPA